DIADGDDVALAQYGALLAVAVDEGAVGRTEILDGQALAARDQAGVFTGGQWIVDDDLVVGGTADGQATGRQPVGAGDRFGGCTGAHGRHGGGARLGGHVDVRFGRLRRCGRRRGAAVRR